VNFKVINMKKEWATHSINIRKSTKKRLDNIGKKNDTYDRLITFLLDFYDENS